MSVNIIIKRDMIVRKEVQQMIMKNNIIIIILIGLMGETMEENSMIRKIIIFYRMNIEEYKKIIKHLTIKIILIILINSLKIVCQNILHGAQL